MTELSSPLNFNNAAMPFSQTEKTCFDFLLARGLIIQIQDRIIHHINYAIIVQNFAFEQDVTVEIFIFFLQKDKKFTKERNVFSR